MRSGICSLYIECICNLESFDMMHWTKENSLFARFLCVAGRARILRRIDDRERAK